MGVPISEKLVRHIAHLSRLDLSDDEAGVLGAQLRSVVEYVEQLGEVDTENVEPTAHPMPATNVLREDVPQASLPAEVVLTNAAEQAAGYFKVPKVLDQETA